MLLAFYAINEIALASVIHRPRNNSPLLHHASDLPLHPALQPSLLLSQPINRLHTCFTVQRKLDDEVAGQQSVLFDLSDMFASSVTERQLRRSEAK